MIWLLSRRGLINGLSALPFVAARSRAAARLAPKREVLSARMWSSEMRPVVVDRPSTYILTLPLECDVKALRIGLANITPAPYRIDGICCCQADRWEPRPVPGWAYFGFSGKSGGGASRPTARPQPVEVPGNARSATGATNVPRIVWSDWIEYPMRAAPDRPQLLLRVLVPPQTLPMAWPSGPGDITWLHPGAQERLVAEQVTPGDYVTNPGKAVIDASPTAFTPIYVIQYRPSEPGFQIVVGGDSHLAAWYTFAQLAALDLTRTDAPISVWNAAWSGQPSNTFWPCLNEAIAEARPSITVIEGWTANDGMNPRADDAYLARVRESVGRTLAMGAVPVIVKGLPRALTGTPELASWQQINSRLSQLDPQALVFDPEPYVEDPSRPGSWRPELTLDGIHANVSGDQAMSGPFASLIRPLLG